MWLNRIKTQSQSKCISQKAERRKVYLHLSQFTFFKEQKQRQSQQEGKRRKVINLPRIPAAAAFSWNYFATRAQSAEIKALESDCVQSIGLKCADKAPILCATVCVHRESHFEYISRPSRFVSHIFSSLFYPLDGVSGDIYTQTKCCICIYSHSINANNRIKSGPASRMNS